MVKTYRGPGDLTKLELQKSLIGTISIILVWHGETKTAFKQGPKAYMVWQPRELHLELKPLQIYSDCIAPPV